MAIENFGSYTEEDPNSRITKGTRRVSWTDLDRNETAFVFKDKTVDYFDGDFTHILTVRMTSQTSGMLLWPWMLANTLDDFRGIEDANGNCLGVGFQATGSSTFIIVLAEVDGGTVYTDTWTSPQVGTPYYLKIVRDESVGTYGTLYCYIYSDAARTTLLDTLTVTLHTSKKDFRYIYAVSSDNFPATPLLGSGDTEDLELLASLENSSVTTLSMTDYAATTITGNGVINSLGLSAVTAHGHAWNTSVDPVTGDNNVDNGAGSLGVFTSSITGLIDGQTYFVRAYATNSEGTTYGANVKFTTNRSNLELIPGEYSIKGNQFHWTGKDGKERYVEGILV